MRMVDGKITSFQSLLGHIFYDWGLGGGTHPYLHQSEDGYWINKTSIFPEHGKFYLSYKMESFEVEDYVFNKLELFYELYKNDADFWTLLDSIENHWHSNVLIPIENGFKLGDLIILQTATGYSVQDKDHHYFTTKACAQKLHKLLAILKS